MVSGREFAKKCREVSKMLNGLAEQAEGAGDSPADWYAGSEAPAIGRLLDLALDFTKMKEF